MGYPQRSWVALGLGVPGWIFVGLMAVGLAIGAAGIGSLQHGWALSVGGVDAVGRVTTLDTSQRDCGSKGNTEICTDYLVGYVFELDGREVTANASVSGSFYGTLQVGQTHPVHYVAADPAVSEIELGNTFAGAVFQALLALGLIMVPAIILARRLRQAREMIYLRAHGAERRAEVLTCQPNNVKINNVPQYVVTWRDANGGTGKSRGRRLEDLPAVGQKITVYADPDLRWPAVWEGDCGTR